MKEYLMVSQNPPSTEENICRICFENGDEEELIHPCKCSGGSKYVHRACLNQWRSLSTNPAAFHTCMECLYEYHMVHVSPEEITVCKDIGTFFSNHLFYFFMINNLLIIIFSYILMGLDHERHLRNRISTNNTIGYYSWSLIFYCIFIFLFYMISFSMIKNKKLYIKYYHENITAGYIFTLISFIVLSIFLDVLLTSLFVTMGLQLFLKIHFSTIRRINTTTDQRIINYVEDENI